MEWKRGPWTVKKEDDGTLDHLYSIRRDGEYLTTIRYGLPEDPDRVIDDFENAMVEFEERKAGWDSKP